MVCFIVGFLFVLFIAAVWIFVAVFVGLVFLFLVFLIQFPF